MNIFCSDMMKLRAGNKYNAIEIFLGNMSRNGKMLIVERRIMVTYFSCRKCNKLHILVCKKVGNTFSNFSNIFRVNIINIEHYSKMGVFHEYSISSIIENTKLLT